jgi:hypothetical protein
MCWICQWAANLTGSQVLLRCPNERLSAARAQASVGGEELGVVGVLVADLGREWWFSKFLDRSGLGGLMAGETAQDGPRAASMDEQGMRGVVEMTAPRIVG